MGAKTSFLKKVFNPFITMRRVLIEPCAVYPLKTYAYHQISFSQEGEDGILQRIFEYQDKGFYVDVGALHPQRFSNTYKCYLKGWRGINIDAMPGCMDLFRKLRPRDVNLELAISENTETLTYFIFEERAFNTFDQTAASSCPSKLVATRQVQTCTLASVLDKYLPPGQPIDFLSVDAEGTDLSVIRSNNWERYRPRYVILEIKDRTDIRDIMATDAYKFMEQNCYSFFGKCFYSVFFKDLQGPVAQTRGDV